MDFWQKKPNKLYETHDDLKAWVREGESAFLDFKVTVNDPFKIAKTLAAFANGKGGKLLVGVADHGEIVGVDVSADQEILYEAATNYCDPPVDILFNWHEELNVTVLEARIAESRIKPHAALNKDDSWQVYIRSNDRTIKLGKKMNFLLHQDDLSDDIDFKSLDSKSQFLLEFLKKNKETSIDEFSRKVNISKRRARRIVIDLMKNGYLVEQELSGNESYSLSPYFMNKY